MAGIEKRGMDSFVSNGPRIVVDTTDFQKVDLEIVLSEVRRYQGEMV